MFYLTALTIAGSDCSGGAGIQADIKTLSALGIYAASVVTAVTVQHTRGIEAVFAVDPKIVGKQIDVVMNDIRPKFIKIGMVNDQATISAIADTLDRFSFSSLIVDPVMVSSSGTRLMQTDALNIFCTALLPQATLLTPNIPETEILSDTFIHSVKDIDTAAQKMMHRYGCSILVKGGHIDGETKCDYLFTKQSAGQTIKRTFVDSTVQTLNTHGTGCTLSSAITAFLARGYSLFEAVAQAKKYIHCALQAGRNVKIGNGTGPLNHFFDPIPLIKNKNQFMPNSNI